MRFNELPQPAPEARRLAKVLRKKMTPAERFLWLHVRNKMLGTKFRRQHPIGPFIVDFIVMQYGLVIEIDGGHHFNSNQEMADQKRTNYLENLGLKVIRFTNDDIRFNVENVIESISREIKKLEKESNRNLP